MLFFCVFAYVVGQPMGIGMPDDVTLTFVGGPGEGRVSLPGFGASLPMIDLMKGPPLEVQKMMEVGGGADQIGVPRPGDHGDASTHPCSMWTCPAAVLQKTRDIPHGRPSIAKYCAVFV